MKNDKTKAIPAFNLQINYSIAAFLAAFMVLIGLLFTTCTPEERIYMTKEMKEEVDSLYKIQFPLLQAEMDSLCKIESKKIIASVRDSIMQERLIERKKRLGY